MRGDILKRKILETGKTQKEVAELLNITPQSINAILSASDVRSSTIEKLAKVLNKSVTFFYEGTDFEKERKAVEDSDKDREILYLRGQVAAYEKALGISRAATSEKANVG